MRRQTKRAVRHIQCYLKWRRMRRIVHLAIARDMCAMIDEQTEDEKDLSTRVLLGVPTITMDTLVLEDEGLVAI